MDAQNLSNRTGEAANDDENIFVMIGIIIATIIVIALFLFLGYLCKQLLNLLPTKSQDVEADIK